MPSLRLLNKDKALPAFTLMEVLMYILIFAVVSGGITTLIIQMFRFQTIVLDRARLNEDIRILTKSIRDDLYLGDSLEVEDDGDLIVRSTFNTPAEVRYFVQNAQIFRQENSSTAIAITHDETNVKVFSILDISTPASAGVVRVTLDMENYPRGPIKPSVSEQIAFTVSLKFI